MSAFVSSAFLGTSASSFAPALQAASPAKRNANTTVMSYASWRRLDTFGDRFNYAALKAKKVVAGDKLAETKSLIEKIDVYKKAAAANAKVDLFMWLDVQNKMNNRGWSASARNFFVLTDLGNRNRKTTGQKLAEEYAARKEAYSLIGPCHFEEGLVKKYPNAVKAFAAGALARYLDQKLVSPSCKGREYIATNAGRMAMDAHSATRPTPVRSTPSALEQDVKPYYALSTPGAISGDLTKQAPSDVLVYGNNKLDHADRHYQAGITPALKRTQAWYSKQQYERIIFGSAFPTKLVGVKPVKRN